MMKTIISIGEALIDFAPNMRDCNLKDVTAFERNAGGAPANVCGAVAKLGGHAKLITQLGTDPFGDHIIDVLNSAGVDTSCILRTAQANTALAFVSLKKDGNRDFSFYRNPSADMLLEESMIQKDWFENGCALHFCSVDLIEAPVKYAHKKAITYAKEHDMIISFDPNVRLPLWDSAENCRNTIWEFIPYADILKISDEEIEFLTGKTDINDVKTIFFDMGVQIILFSMGKNGSAVFTPDFELYVTADSKISVIDTTGAGDSIIGAFLYCIASDGFNRTNLSALSKKQAQNYLVFSNQYAEYGIRHKGAIPAYATYEEFVQYISQTNNGGIK